MSEIDNENKLRLTGAIVSAYVGKHSIPSSELAALLQNVYASLDQLAAGEVPAEPLVPAVPVAKSVTPEYIISLEDGRRFKSLKRHLAAQYGLSPEEYRARWGLPADYPMVAPNYAAKRSQLAKSMGLGREAPRSAPPLRAVESQ
ncbi:MucR family transcriptional regulator [Georhizobium profundi]|jgi:predicted transcriptional regulator|uniref:MucR family transcriptional regulator n=1 Tax=Georhizobium profundi TaxID=2341112 RepID=A0A3Q8XPS9_9HYPH|nr:MucR family transcriptional regulator [Georhizobium profundi]AZN71294.1 MucR family transcriptional regulator [Georhizobium profundi]